MKLLRLVFLALALTAALAFTGCGESDDDPLSPSNAPVAPTGLTITATSSSVHVVWTAATDADSILIERAEGAASTTFATIARLVGTASSYHDMNIMTATTYRYKVTAKNSVGNTSSNIMNATTLSVATWQSDSDNQYDGNYFIAAYNDTDSAMVAKVIPNHTGKLLKVKVMFGNWNAGGVFQKTNVIVKVVTGAINGTAVYTTTVNANDIVTNGTGSFNWQEFDCSASNITITSGTNFWVTVTPVFTDFTSSSTQRMYISSEQNSPSTNPVETWVLSRDGSSSRITDMDVAISAIVEY
ncbi:MAG: fibronectin type III domain-containing protein [bacterium]|nr:fibronectin type III domain-containing protein [bacterium]